MLMSYKILEARKNLMNMMKLQGYRTTPFENVGVYEISAKYDANDLDMLFERDGDTDTNSPQKKILVRFCLKEKLNVKMLEEIREDIFLLSPKLSVKTDILMMVTQRDANDTMRAHLRQIWNKDNIMVSIVSLARLQFNLLAHSLVPPHVVITDSDELERECFKPFNIRTIEELPDISRFDPVAIILGMVPGQVCRIERPSKTAITSLYFRKCINE